MKSKKGKIIAGVIGVFVLLSAISAAIHGPRTPDSQNTVSQNTVQPVPQVQNEIPAEPATSDVSEVEQETETSSDSENSEYTIKHGDFISALTSDSDGKNVIVIKAKITPLWDNKDTIEQNYFNVADLIINQGCDTFDEVQYWAVADATNGEEVKAISFTVNSSLIQSIKNETILPTQLGDYVDDLYILPSLNS